MGYDQILIIVVIAGIVALALLILLPVLLIWLPRHRRRIEQEIYLIIQEFQKNNAVGINNAKTINELRAKTKSVSTEAQIVAGVVGTLLAFGGGSPGAGEIPDSRNEAWQELMKAKVIQRTKDKKWYLSEEHLSISKWKQ
jgi:hypothetical protein